MVIAVQIPHVAKPIDGVAFCISQSAERLQLAIRALKLLATAGSLAEASTPAAHGPFCFLRAAMGEGSGGGLRFDDIRFVDVLEVAFDPIPHVGWNVFALYE
jgi:hypothetical protein